jgi:predicted secreted protein
MKLWLALLILPGLLIMPPPGRGDAGGGPLTLYEKDRGGTFTLKPGEKLLLYLRNPQSGGYDLKDVTFDQAILKLVSHQKLPPKPSPTPLMGDFGQFFYEWEALRAGVTDILITISRPWEKKAPEEYWRVTVKVTD